MSSLRIREISTSDLKGAVAFCDREIGEAYYDEKQMLHIVKASQKNGIATSFVLEDPDCSEKIVGLRLTCPPGQWLEGPLNRPLHPELWGVPFEDTAYFQSLFINKRYQRQGWGVKLSLKSIESLKRLGAKAIVCHSWKESQGNSSQSYLDKLGFKPLVDIPGYWSFLDYQCVRCGKPCQCTATEMLYVL